MDLRGKCECCGKPDSRYMTIGVGGPWVKRFCCGNENCETELRHDYYEQKRKADNNYYSNIPQYDDDDGWGY